LKDQNSHFVEKNPVFSSENRVARGRPQGLTENSYLNIGKKGLKYE
jgi:hypothetical protein